MLKIGVSSCFFHADPQRAIFKGKSLLYLVQDVGDWLLNEHVLPVLIPTLPAHSAVTLAEMIGELDGLVLQGGADVAPESYGETPLKPEWSGDRRRDVYEIALVEEFVRQNKPVLGLCRGLQLLNVAFKGTLYQDIGTQVEKSFGHRNWDIYDQNFHEIKIVPKTGFEKLYQGVSTATVNSVHHQAIKDLAPNFRAEAFSVTDGLIEAIRYQSDRYIVGVQWHPEFQKADEVKLLSTKPLLKEFMAEVAQRKKS